MLPSLFAWSKVIFPRIKLVNLTNNLSTKKILGKGPVHIHGHHLVGMDADDNLEEELGDEEIESECDGDEADEPSKKKPKLSANSKEAKNNEKNSKKK